ncbi:hypothetical protein NIES4071_76070 [Calothrix sp. NIES-4071]|nr:hypothetical protein NIES4071_76070 [Calothrix sp. NIES-4071]BAZ61882.1 hypothetical protein NIES4105_76020 [Calothrix sp. NIES-4105]
MFDNDSEPEPDITILRNRGDDYLDSHPSPEDILLLIEIADSSLKYDQEVKLPLYAEAGIKYYWIFNLADNHLEAHSEPLQDSQPRFTYRKKEILLPTESVTLPCFPNLTLDLSKVFPRVGFYTNVVKSIQVTEIINKFNKNVTGGNGCLPIGLDNSLKDWNSLDNYVSFSFFGDHSFLTLQQAMSLY